MEVTDLFPEHMSSVLYTDGTLDYEDLNFSTKNYNIIYYI